MTTFLSALGAVFAVLLVGIVAVFFYIRTRWHSFARDLGELGKAVTKPDMPSRIELEEVEDLEWSDAEEVERATRALKSRGFETIGSFRVTGIPDLRLHALCNRVERCYATIFDTKSLGIWTDVMVAYESGEELTVSNRPRAGQLDRPGDMKLRVEPGVTPSRLVDSILAHRGTGPFSQATPEGYASRYSASHARHMDWRNERGGPTIEEVRRIAAASGQEVDEAAVRASYELERGLYARKLDEECLEVYVGQSGVSASELEDPGEDLLVIHEFSITDAVFKRCAELLRDEGGAVIPGRGVEAQARAAFEAWNARLPEDRRFQKVGEIWSPVHASLYRLVLQTA